MKIRESGMPKEALWAGFFEPEAVLRKLGLSPACGDVVDFGCGYGTFTVPAARIASGVVHALDVDPDMVRATQARAEAERLANVRVYLRDFVADGSGLPPASADYAMLFNILHAEKPELLLHEARRILAPAGILSIIHWNCDPTTPRGPSMDIRPSPEQCRQWADQSGFRLLPFGSIPLPPYHYGMAFARR